MSTHHTRAGRTLLLWVAGLAACEPEPGPVDAADTVTSGRDTVTLPGDTVTLPGDTVSLDTATLPGDTFTSGDTVSLDTVTLPGDTFTSPEDTSTDDTSTSTDDTSTSTDDTSASTEDSSVEDGGDVVAAPGCADGFHVDAWLDYQGEADGSDARPYRTIDAAVVAHHTCDPLIVSLPVDGAHVESVVLYGVDLELRGRGSGLYGRLESIGGDLVLDDLVVDGGEGVGVHKRGGLLHVRNVTVSHVSAVAGAADSGFGILLEDGASGDLAAVILEDNRGPGLALRGSTTEASAALLTVRRSGTNTGAAIRLRELYGKFLGGVEVHEGATLFLSLSAVTDGNGVGIGVFDGGRARIDSVSVERIARVTTVDADGEAFVESGLIVANGAVADIERVDVVDAFIGVQVLQGYLTQLLGTLQRLNTGVFFSDAVPSATFVRTPTEYRWWGCTRDTLVLDTDASVYVTSYQSPTNYPGPGDVVTGPLESYCRRVEP
ncbi:MAG: hypothetical protein IT385_13185 [Deltaproteobacteria bacterium]|nr:hypothetical protein [Deltaproteobacteria bacterium]